VGAVFDSRTGSIPATRRPWNLPGDVHLKVAEREGNCRFKKVTWVRKAARWKDVYAGVSVLNYRRINGSGYFNISGCRKLRRNSSGAGGVGR
jgi:hypothetical protein